MHDDLIARARRGEESACQIIVEDHREAVFRLAYLITGDADVAEDVAQDVFIRALGSLHRYDSSRPLRPWLLRITTNLARNRQRSLGRYWAAVRRFMQQTPDRTPDIETQSAREAEAVALWQAVRRLNQREQDVIYLRYFMDLSVDDTAAALEVQPGTVKSRLHRALQRLKWVIEQDFPLLSEGRI